MLRHVLVGSGILNNISVSVPIGCCVLTPLPHSLIVHCPWDSKLFDSIKRIFEPIAVFLSYTIMN